MYLAQIKVGSMGNFSYLIADSVERRGIVIDPGWPGIEADKILGRAEDDEISIRYIVATHFHSDHIGGVRYLMERSRAELVLHEGELYSMNCLGFEPDIIIKNDGIYNLGGLSVRIIHTPGHSPGSICLYTNRRLFTGDTLFVGGCGRADLPRSDPEKLYSSIYDKIMILPDETEVYPGHDYGTSPFSTIGREKMENPYLKCPSLEAFLRLRMGKI